MAVESELRPSPIAGKWYSGDPDELGRQVDGFINQAEQYDHNGVVAGIIAPHAGYQYSGRTAGYAFRNVLGASFDLVAVISPLHAYSSHPVLTSAYQGYATPLGAVWIDKDAVGQLANELRHEAGIDLAEVKNDGEHSLEIELPFLQRALEGDFQLLPIMMHTLSSQGVRQVGLSLARVLQGRSVLLVASTDLSHFHSGEVAKQLDDTMLGQIESFSPEGVLDAERTGTGLACGAAAVSAVLWAAREMGADEIKIVHYSTSGDETGDHHSVVGYGAAVILKPS